MYICQSDKVVELCASFPQEGDRSLIPLIPDAFLSLLNQSPCI